MSAKIKAEYMYFVKGTLFWPNQKIWQSRQLHFLGDLSTTLFDLPSLQKFSAISYFMILLFILLFSTVTLRHWSLGHFAVLLQLLQFVIYLRLQETKGNLRN